MVDITLDLLCYEPSRERIYSQAIKEWFELFAKKILEYASVRLLHQTGLSSNPCAVATIA